MHLFESAAKSAKRRHRIEMLLTGSPCRKIILKRSYYVVTRSNAQPKTFL